MAKWVFSVHTWTPVAVADNANFTDNGHMTLIGGTTTQLIDIVDVYMGGLATVQSPTLMTLARDMIVGATLTALASPNSCGPLHPSTAPLAAPAVGFVASTTKPKRSNDIAMPKLNIPFNSFGGLVRWHAGPDEAFTMLGNTQPLGEISLSAFTGGTPGLMGSHFVFEPK